LNSPEHGKEKVVLVFSLAVCVSVWMDVKKEKASAVSLHRFFCYLE
jgi:hypothetical protein